MSKRAMQGLLLGIFLAVTGGIAAEPQPPHEVEDFIREDRFDEVAVSRKGTYVAVTVPEADRTVLYVFRTGGPGRSRGSKRVREEVTSSISSGPTTIV